MRTHFVLLRFATISLTCAAIDNLAFYIVYHATGTIAGAQTIGRIISMMFNYTLVHRAVFVSGQQHRVALPRYLLIVFVNALISYVGIRLLTAYTPLGVLPAKMLAETLLFIANFAMQRAFVFAARPLPGPPSAF